MNKTNQYRLINLLINNQFVRPKWVKNRIVLTSSITAGNALMDLTSTNAFAAPVGVDLSVYQGGRHMYWVQDSGGRLAFGFIKAAGVAETVGEELVTNGDFAAVTKAAAKSVTGITKANPGVVTFAAGHGYANGDVIYFSGLTQMTELNTQYWQLRANSGDTFQLATVYDTTSLDTSGYGDAETTGGNCAQKVTLTGWVQGARWHVGVDGAGGLNNVAQANNALININIYQSSIYATTNKLYKKTVAIDIVSGEIATGVGGIGGASFIYTSGGNKTKYDTGSSGANGNVTFYPNVTFTGTIDNVSVKQVTAPSATGATITSTKGGATMAFAYQHASFNANLACTFAVRYVGD